MQNSREYDFVRRTKIKVKNISLQNDKMGGFWNTIFYCSHVNDVTKRQSSRIERKTTTIGYFDVWQGKNMRVAKEIQTASDKWVVIKNQKEKINKLEHVVI